MTDTIQTELIVRKRWRVWYKSRSVSINEWAVQRKTWYGRWKTIGWFWTAQEAKHAKEVMIREDIETYQGEVG